MRNLASIQKIKDISPIEGADNIEVATVLGWKVVVKKNEFKVEDLVVYCEIDSILPEKPEFEFMRDRKFKVKTIKLRNQVSQGLIFPLDIIPEGITGEPIVLKEGTDVTDNLGITKYEPPIPACLSGVMKGNFPSFIPKTDETRVQVLQKLLDKYKGETCAVTEKLDGSSSTFYIKNGVFGVCSRNIDLIETSDNSFWKVARQMDIEEKLRSLDGNYALQGELIGEGIQGNKLKITSQTIRFFNLFDIDNFCYFNHRSFMGAMYKLSLPSVPIISESYTLSNNIDEIIQMAERKSFLHPDVWAEGIVIRPLNEKLDLLLSNEKFNNERVSFKAINPKFLLKYGE